MLQPPSSSEPEMMVILLKLLNSDDVVIYTSSDNKKDAHWFDAKKRSTFEVGYKVPGGDSLSIGLVKHSFKSN